MVKLGIRKLAGLSLLLTMLVSGRLVAGQEQPTLTQQPAASSTPTPPPSGRNAFVTKLDGASSTWAFSTLYGGIGSDVAKDVVATDAGVYITGETTSANIGLALPTPLIGYGGSKDAFVVRLRSEGGAGGEGQQ